MLCVGRSANVLMRLIFVIGVGVPFRGSNGTRCWPSQIAVVLVILVVLMGLYNYT